MIKLSRKFREKVSLCKNLVTKNPYLVPKQDRDFHFINLCHPERSRGTYINLSFNHF